MGRHQRSWQAFVERALCFRDHEQLYYGVCVLDKWDRVEYSHGCFRGDDVAIGGSAAPLDATQFRRALEQHARIAMRDAATDNSSADRPRPPIDAVASLRLGSVSFQVVSTSFSSLCAVASGKSYGLVAQRLPFGLLVVACRHPHSVEDIAPLVERYCQALR